jgi:hypothetical protein
VVHRWITGLHEEDIGDLRVVEVNRQVGRTSATVRLHVGTLDWTNVNTLESQRRGNEWKIIYQVLQPPSAQ